MLPLSEVSIDNLPWPTRDDLISMKAISAFKRRNANKAATDVEDIQNILEVQPGPLLFPGSPTAEVNKAEVKK